MSLELYDKKYIPKPLWFNNTVSICYFNSLLQSLLSCSSFVNSVFDNEKYMCKTKTGETIYKLVSLIIKGGPDTVIANMSACIVNTLSMELRRKKLKSNFGSGQESASEALIFLLEMIDDSPLSIINTSSPVTRLFLHRYKNYIYCNRCNKNVSEMKDYNLEFNLFYFDSMDYPDNPEDFSSTIKKYKTICNDYTCDYCKHKQDTVTTYCLTMVPEIMIIKFNVYVEHGGKRYPRYFPPFMEFPTNGNTSKIIFKVVSQIEHSGSLGSGHYWSRSLRNDDNVYIFNDSSVTKSSFTKTASTYLVFYHYDKTIVNDDVIDTMMNVIALD